MTGKTTTKPFAKIDIHLHSNDKLLPLSHGAFRLYICSLTFCKEQRSDGHIGVNQAKQLARSQRVPMTAIKELLDQGRYEQNGSGYVVHDFDEWQQIDHEVREKRAEAGRAGGVRSGEIRRSKTEANRSVPEENRSKTDLDRSKVEANASVLLPEPRSKREAKRSVESESESERDLEAPNGALSPVVPSPDLLRPRPKVTPARLVMVAYALARREHKPGSTWLPTPTREAMVNKWLRTGFTLNDLIDAAVGWRRDPFSLGQNDRGIAYFDFELIFRDPAHIEKFRDLERAAHEAETVFIDEEPEWQKKRREILEREARKED